MTFEQLLAELADMPAVPHDADEQLLATLRANFPSFTEED